MTDYPRYEVAAFKLWVTNRTLQMLGADEGFLDLSELLARIERRDAKAAAKLAQFFKSYDAWYELSARMVEDDGFCREHQEELLDRIYDRDSDRKALLAYLNPPR